MQTLTNHDLCDHLLYAIDALDLYIDRKQRVWIIDFNPFGDPTNALLFEWSELIALSNNELKRVDDEAGEGSDEGELDEFFRVVASDQDTLPDASGSYRGPIDVHLSQDFPKFMDICKQQQNDSANDEAVDGIIGREIS
mmetsp:Transcript_3511/g.4844  ORF Transcript_3511/g.4844 Transcript_3511/m.4844 type:complete len:139 (+) Transcript_3511:738-1154(+)